MGDERDGSDHGAQVDDEFLRPGVAPGSGATSAATPFEAVYREHYDRLVRAASLLSGSRETAEEVVQDAFVALYPRFGEVDNVSSYLYQSVVNGCWGRVRRTKVAEKYRHLTAVREAPPSEFDHTWAELARLAPQRRAAVVLRYYADLPIADIAVALGCRPGTVKSMIHRALAQLKDVMDR